MTWVPEFGASRFQHDLRHTFRPSRPYACTEKRRFGPPVYTSLLGVPPRVDFWLSCQNQKLFRTFDKTTCFVQARAKITLREKTICSVSKKFDHVINLPITIESTIQLITKSNSVPHRDNVSGDPFARHTMQLPTQTTIKSRIQLAMQFTVPTIGVSTAHLISQTIIHNSTM